MPKDPKPADLPAEPPINDPQPYKDDPPPATEPPPPPGRDLPLTDPKPPAPTMNSRV